MLVVSHNRSFLNDVCNRIAVIAHQQLTVFEATFRDSWAPAKMAGFMPVKREAVIPLPPGREGLGDRHGVPRRGRDHAVGGGDAGVPAASSVGGGGGPRGARRGLTRNRTSISRGRPRWSGWGTAACESESSVRDTSAGLPRSCSRGRDIGSH